MADEYVDLPLWADDGDLEDAAGMCERCGVLLINWDDEYCETCMPLMED